MKRKDLIDGVFIPGVLPRASKFGEVCLPFAESGIPIIPRDQWAGLIGKFTLRPQIKKIKGPQRYGSCATESTTQSMEITDISCGRPWVELNPLFIYQTTSGGRDGGSNIDRNLEFAREYGCAPESVWPRSKGMYAKPSPEAYEAAKSHKIVEFFDIANEEEFGSALFAPYPVVFGIPGHSIVAVSLKSPTTIEYADSGGPSRGDNGFLTCSFRNVVWNYGAFAVRTTTPR